MKKLNKDKRCVNVKLLNFDNSFVTNHTLKKNNQARLRIYPDNHHTNMKSFIHLDEPYNINEIKSNILKKNKRKANSFNTLTSYTNLSKKNLDIILRNPYRLSHSFIRSNYENKLKGKDIYDSFIYNSITLNNKFLHSAKLTESMLELSKSHNKMKSKSKEKIGGSIINYGTSSNNSNKTNSQINFNNTRFYKYYKENSSITLKTTNTNIYTDDLYSSERFLNNSNNNSIGNLKQSINSLHNKRQRNEIIAEIIPEEKLDYFLTENKNNSEQDKSNCEETSRKVSRKDILIGTEIEDNTRIMNKEMNLKNSKIELYENITDNTQNKLVNQTNGDNSNKSEGLYYFDQLILSSTPKKNVSILSYYIDESCSEYGYDAADEFLDEKKKFFKEIAEYKTKSKPEIYLINGKTSSNFNHDNKKFNGKNDLREFEKYISQLSFINKGNNNLTSDDDRKESENNLKSKLIKNPESFKVKFSKYRETDMNKVNNLNQKSQHEITSKDLNLQIDENKKLIKAQLNKENELENIKKKLTSKELFNEAIISNKNNNDTLNEKIFKNNGTYKSNTELYCICLKNKNYNETDHSLIIELSDITSEKPENYIFEIPSKYIPNFKEIKINSEEITKDGGIYRIYSNYMIEKISKNKNISRVFI